jgi:hypothetical protein
MPLLDNTPDTVRLDPPGCDEPVYLRYPSFAEWHALATAHRELDGATPSADLIAKTLSTCLCDEAGKTLGVEASAIKKGGHRRVMWIYQQCWDTVLLSGDAAVAKLEKNSEAGQD